MLYTKTVSSLEKCFPDQSVDDFPALSGEQVILKNETFAFQVLVQNGANERFYVRPKIEGVPEQYVSLREVVCVPSDYPAMPEDKDVLRREPGLFPDLLRPLHYDGMIRLNYGQTHALWIEIDPAGELTGSFTVSVTVSTVPERRFADWPGEDDPTETSTETLRLTVADRALPEQELIFTQWFYPDCLADYYHVEPFSERHFEICENFMRAGVKAGRNMFLLPVFTTVLDTRIGGERTTCQLVNVYKNGENYAFGFDLLDRWLAMCARCGVKYHEVSHFFTQWGAAHAPKIMATENGVYKRLFGWDTDSVSPEYLSFLRAFVKSFLEHMRARGEDKNCFFHISDEPDEEHLPRYEAAVNALKDLLKGYPILDSMPCYASFEKGFASVPLTTPFNVMDFVEHGVPNLFFSFCGDAPGCNLLTAAPLARVRFLGYPLFKYRIKGFVNWGYNFYNNLYSFDHIDPFLSTTGEGFVASGDTFVVYPGENGQPLESTRMRVLLFGLQDLRAMRLCETLYDHETVVRALEEAGGGIAFVPALTDGAKLLAMRKKLNEMILAKL